MLITDPPGPPLTGRNGVGEHNPQVDSDLVFCLRLAPSTSAVHAAARRRDGTDQQASSGHHVLLCALRYIVRNMNSAFPADILNLQVAEHGTDARVVTVTGEVDALTAPRLADVLTAQLAVARIVVANLDGVQFMSSAGLRVLFEIDELATKQDRCLRLVSNSPTVALVLETSGLRDQFTVADNVPDALNNVR